MSRSGRLAELLFGEGGAPMEEVLGHGSLLRRRLLLAELVAPPPALRRPGQRSPLAPRADAAPDGD